MLELEQLIQQLRSVAPPRTDTLTRRQKNASSAKKVLSVLTLTPH